MEASADPLDGWNLHEVLSIDVEPTTNDVYGKMIRYRNSL